MRRKSVFVKTGCLHGFAIRRATVAGQRHQANPRVPRVLADPLGHLVAIDTGQPDVDQGNIETVLLQNLQALAAILGRLDLGLRVRNVFDDNAVEPSPTEAVPAGSLMPDDFPLDERSYHLTARLRF